MGGRRPVLCGYKNKDYMSVCAMCDGPRADGSDAQLASRLSAVLATLDTTTTTPRQILARLQQEAGVITAAAPRAAPGTSAQQAGGDTATSGQLEGRSEGTGSQRSSSTAEGSQGCGLQLKYKVVRQTMQELMASRGEALPGVLLVPPWPSMRGAALV